MLKKLIEPSYCRDAGMSKILVGTSLYGGFNLPPTGKNRFERANTWLGPILPHPPRPCTSQWSYCEESG